MWTSRWRGSWFRRSDPPSLALRELHAPRVEESLCGARSEGRCGAATERRQDRARSVGSRGGSGRFLPGTAPGRVSGCEQGAHPQGAEEPASGRRDRSQRSRARGALEEKGYYPIIEVLIGVLSHKPTLRASAPLREHKTAPRLRHLRLHASTTRPTQTRYRTTPPQKRYHRQRQYRKKTTQLVAFFF